MNKLTIAGRVNGLPEGGSAAFGFTHESTALHESASLDLTSNVGYSDIYTDIYTGPTSVRCSNSYVVIVPPELTTAPLRVSASSTDLGIPLSSKGASVLCTPSSVLYISTTSSEAIENVYVLSI